MRTVATTRQAPSDLTSPDFADAELSVKIASTEFADTAVHGRDVALKVFNARVGFWANRFTNVRYRRWVYVLGECMDGETHEFTISMARLIKKYRDLFPGQSIGTTTIQKYNRLFDSVIYDVQHNVQGPDDEHPGAYRSHTYTMHFARVLVGDQVVPHDFTQVSPGAKAAESDTSHSPTKSANGSGNGGDDGSVNGGGDVLFPFSSPNSSTASSRTAEDEETRYRVDQGEEEEMVDRAKSPAHLLRRNTFKVWLGKSGKVVWFNLDRAAKAPADARVVSLSPDEAQYFWRCLETGDRDEEYAARTAFLLAPQDARDEKVFRWRHRVEILAQERREREEAVRQEEKAEREAQRAALCAEFDRLSARYEELTGRGASDVLGYLTGPNGSGPGLARKVQCLAEKVGAEEYYAAHKDDAPWNGDPSALKVPNWVDGTYSGRSKVVPGEVFRAWVTDDGEMIKPFDSRAAKARYQPGMTEGWFRWTPENGLELAKPDEGA